MSADVFYEIDRALSEGLITGNFQKYTERMHLPLQVIRVGAPDLNLSTMEELEADFRLYHDVMRLHAVTDIFREITAQKVHENGDITVACITHIMSRANRVLDPFGTEFDLTQVNEKWLVRTIRGTIRHTDWAPGKAGLHNPNT